jgi:hypothetical protein
MTPSARQDTESKKETALKETTSSHGKILVTSSKKYIAKNIAKVFFEFFHAIK